MKAFLVLIMLIPGTALAQRFPWNSTQRLYLPNSISIESSYGESIVKTKPSSAGGLQASTLNDSSDRFQNTGMSLAFTHTPSYASLFGWSFQWTPVATLSRNALSAGETSKFDFYRGGVGLGPELGWTSLVGTFYTNIIPELGYSYATSASTSSQTADWRVSVNAGYFKYFTRDWVIRAFVRHSMEDSSLWKKSLSQSGQQVESVSSTYAGLSLAFVY